jgi:hypothetical protein
MADRQSRRCSQREIREGKAPRRLAERGDRLHRYQVRGNTRGAYLARRLTLAVAVVFLVIASTVVHSDDYSPTGGPKAFVGLRFNLGTIPLGPVELRGGLPPAAT